MSIIVLFFIVAAIWCAVLALGTALFAVSQKADHDEDTVRGLATAGPRPSAERTALRRAIA
jgi:hypothetical protein